MMVLVVNGCLGPELCDLFFELPYRGGCFLGIGSYCSSSDLGRLMSIFAKLRNPPFEVCGVQCLSPRTLVSFLPKAQHFSNREHRP